jgi:hypothetical protein
MLLAMVNALRKSAPQTRHFTSSAMLEQKFCFELHVWEERWGGSRVTLCCMRLALCIAGRCAQLRHASRVPDILSSSGAFPVHHSPPQTLHLSEPHVRSPHRPSRTLSRLAQSRGNPFAYLALHGAYPLTMILNCFPDPQEPERSRGGNIT